MESTDASYGSQPNLPPGFRFHPTDEELVVHYLKKKATSLPLPVSIIADVDLYKFDPWELPAKAAFGEQEWYFFSPRDRKYPNGARPNRAATSGYWKATGTDKPVLTSNGTKKVGVKKALVFYGGKPPKGIKTNWIMHEYRLTDHKSNSSKPHGCDLLGNKNNSLRLDDWVLCRIYKKNKNHKPMDHDREDSTDINMIGSMKVQLPKTVLTSFGGVIENDHHLFDIGILSNDGLINTTTASLSSHLISSSNSKPVMSLVSDSTMSNFVPLKRSLHGLYWNEDDDQVGLSSSKRMQLHNTSSEGNNNNNNNNNNGASNSTISLLSQIPQNPSLLQQQAILGSFADGLFRAPYELPAGINWYS